ncbi:MAG: pyrroloquinoline quinone precursor peptide PqqA [Minwuia sp.]|uniref:pyrroloquinoline quinone precursor peptide PqqA n=1 Tax=Minwuia sp. TaxID=2493630 RepID=UPI003A880068
MARRRSPSTGATGSNCSFRTRNRPAFPSCYRYVTPLHFGCTRIHQPIKKGGGHMAWTTPVIEEICIGMEINGYFPAEF